MEKLTNKVLQILLVENDEILASKLSSYLTYSGFEPTLTTNGYEAIFRLKNRTFDLIITDIQLPYLDGLTLTKEIRQLDRGVPIIVISDLSNMNQIKECFHAGVDDFIAKPFSRDEFIYRVQAIYRRCNSFFNRDAQMRISSLTIDTLTHSLNHEGKKMHLTMRELELLLLLVEYRNETLTRNFALERIWHHNSRYTSRILDVYIARLRKILKVDPKIRVKNVHGVGYQLCV